MYNEQCQGGSVCMNNSCNCPSGGTVQGNRCSINEKLCEMGQVQIDNRCYNTSQIGQTCQLAQQCLGGSTCRNNICICPSGTQQQGDRCIGSDNNCSSNQVAINGQCYPKAQIDEFCLYNEQCEGGPENEASASCTLEKLTSSISEFYVFLKLASKLKLNFLSEFQLQAFGSASICAPNEVLIDGLCFPRQFAYGRICVQIKLQAEQLDNISDQAD
uniref:EB domain-containing protein n=1 Tax=Parascaris equorum TaxID=6256 RepID=A0A914S5F9_PAREQ